VEELMMTIWGRLERISTDLPNDRWVQIRTVVPGSVAIRTYVLVDEKTLIARGTEQVSLSNLREGEFVEVTFRSARTGLVKADAIYAQPEFMMSKSKLSSSVPSQTSPQCCMQQASSGPESVSWFSDQRCMNTVSGILGHVRSTLMSHTLRLETRATVEKDTILRE
jgi:hypothetical protein